MNELQQHNIDMAGIWFSNSFGTRSEVQKQKCELLGWYYLMRAIMEGLLP